MNEEIKKYILSKYGNDALIFLVCCKFDINYEVNEEIFLKLVKDNIIIRDYRQEKILIKIPLFTGEDFNEVIDDDFKRIEEVSERIDEYRLLFKGIRTKSIGDKKECIDKIIKWLTKNQKYTFNDIIEAVEYYISNTELKYISNANNFIYNYDNYGNEISTLSIIIDTIKMGTLNKKFN